MWAAAGEGGCARTHVAQLRGDDLLDAVLASLDLREKEIRLASESLDAAPRFLCSEGRDLLRLLADVAHHLMNQFTSINSIQ